MNESLELLQKINWFLKPVADFIIFLFTTKTGYVILLAFIGAYIVFTVSNSVRVRRLMHRAAQGGGQTGIPFNELLYIIGSEIIKMFFGIVANVPVLLIIVLLLSGIVGMSSGLSSLEEYLTNQQKIKEMRIVLKHLDKRYKVAEIEITNVDYTNNTTSLRIAYTDYATGKLTNPQDITIKGHDIYFLNVILNFDYTEVAQGKRNIVVPYAIFSEAVPKSKGIKLLQYDENGVPFMFRKTGNDLYGIDSVSYYNRIEEIAKYIKDPEAARKDGVRSIYGAATHFVRTVKPGQKFWVWVEQTGGLTIKEQRAF